jgi:general secretion pathway protein J
MMRSRRQQRSTVAGFTLIEALIATVLMGMILTALTSVTAQWLPNWDRGYARAQRSELVSIALDRLVADLGASEFVTANRDSKLPVFDGTPLGVTLVRSAFGPNSQPGLEMVRIVETADRNGTALVRSRVPFVPLAAGATSRGPMGFSDPVALLRPPFGVTFAYAGPDGVWKDTWQNAPLLPMLVRLTVRDVMSERALSVSTAALVHVELPAACTRPKDKPSCIQGQQPEGAPAAQGNQGNQQNAARSL